MVNDLVKLNIPKKNIHILKDRRTYELGAFQIKPIETWHDVQNTSYLINFKPYTVYYATDTCKLPEDECLKGLDLYCLEANYDEDLLEKHIQECIDNGDKENKLFYLNRVKTTHLSEKKCNDFLLNNMTNNSSYIYLHKSSYNYEEREE